MNEQDCAVRLRGVRKHYRHFELGPVDLEVSTGSIMGFIGANGAGKSTTIRILMGLLYPDAGAVEVLGYALPRQQVHAKRDIGFVSEDLRLYKAASIGWHMDFVRSIYPGWDAAYAAQLLRRFDLHVAHRIKGLSHGQRVKAALLLALARRPRLLVLDEPTTGLDPVARNEVLQSLAEVLADEQRSVLFSSQNTLDVEQISDSICFIDQGRIIDCAGKEDFLERWRRIRVEVPPGARLPPLPGVVAVAGSERLPVLTTDRYSESLASAWQQAGAMLRAVEPMTLEEIFVSRVTARRQDASPAHPDLRSAA